MSPTILWLFYCFAVPNVRSDVELAGANLNSDTSLENNANSDVADNNRNDLDLTRLTGDSNLAVSDANLNHDADSANRLSRQNELDSSVSSNSQDNLRNLRSNLNGVGVYDFTNHALRHPALNDLNSVLNELDALHHANAVKNGRLNVVTRSGLNDQNQVSVLDGSRLAALIALKHGVVGNGVSLNRLTNSRGLNALENAVVQRSAALREVNSVNLNGVNNVNGLNGENENLLSTNQRSVVSKNRLGNLLNNNQEQNLNAHLANEVNAQSDSGLSRSGISGVYYRSANVHGLDGVSHGNLGLNQRLLNSNADNLLKLRLSRANNNDADAVNGVNSLGLLNNLHSVNLENSNLERQNNLLNRVHANDVAKVLEHSNANDANLLNELSRSGLLGAANLNNQKVSLNALKEAAKLGLQQPGLLDRSLLMGRSGRGLNEEDLLNAADHHNEGKLNALSALVSISDVNNNNNLRHALNNLAHQNSLSRAAGSNLNGLGLVGGSNRHDSNALTSSSGLHGSNVNSLKSSHPSLLINSVSLNSLSNVDADSGLNSLNNPEPSNREHGNLSNEDNSLDSDTKLETRLPAAEIELDNENRRYLGRMRNLGLGYGKGRGSNRVIYSPYDLPNPLPYRPHNRQLVLPRPQGWYQPYQPTTYIPYRFQGRSGLNDDESFNDDGVDLTLFHNVNNVNDLDSLSNKLVDVTDYDIDNLLSLFEKSELNAILTGKKELRSGVEVNSDNLASELDALNLSELNNKNLNNRRLLKNMLRRLVSNSGNNAKVANNDLVNKNSNAKGLHLVGVDPLVVKSHNNDLAEAVNEALKASNANELNLEDVENVVANARRNFMRRG